VRFGRSKVQNLTVALYEPVILFNLFTLFKRSFEHETVPLGGM
jgi:hypothetical protein